MKKNKKIIRIILVISIAIWMCFIYQLSNQDAETSSDLSEKVTKMIVKTDDEEKFDLAEAIVRKIAHLTEYSIGGVLFLLLFLTFEFSEIKKMIFSELIGIEYAITDEIHQYFIDGRASQVLDVIIDSIGIGIGICVCMIVYKIVIIILNKINRKTPT